MKAPPSTWIVIAALVAGAVWAFIATQPAEPAELPADPCQRWTRFEGQYTPSLHSCGGNVAQYLYPNMTAAQLWFVEHEIAFLNPSRGETLTVPVYQPYTGGKKVCNDLRNWHVAVLKGRKYGVAAGLLIAIRSHENPSPKRDRYAYGVVAHRNTNLWTQAEWGARIVERIAKKQGWDPMRPTRSNLVCLAMVYVGQGEASARHWSKCVYTMMKRAQP